MESPPAEFLQATAVMDYHHPAVIGFVREWTDGVADPREEVVRLYYAVRDAIRYDPYSIDLSVPGLRSSNILKTGRGWCVPKAALLAACCRSVGIAAKLGYADVKNHLSTARMRARMKTDIFMWHGYTSIFLEGRWVKATPAFNIELCDKFRLKPLEFDGGSDSLYHPFDLEGNKHMEYVRQRGEYADVPIDAIAGDIRGMFSEPMPSAPYDFDADVQGEMGSQ